MKEIKCRVGNTGAKLRLNGEVWSVVTCLFADDTVLRGESEGDLQRVVKEFYSVCKRKLFFYIYPRKQLKGKIKVEKKKAHYSLFLKEHQSKRKFSFGCRGVLTLPS